MRRKQTSICEQAESRLVNWQVKIDRFVQTRTTGWGRVRINVRELDRQIKGTGKKKHLNNTATEKKWFYQLTRIGILGTTWLSRTGKHQKRHRHINLHV